MDIKDIEIGKCYKIKLHDEIINIKILKKEFSFGKYKLHVEDNYKRKYLITPEWILESISNINIPDWKPNVNSEDIQTLSKVIDICLDSGDKELLSSLIRLKNKINYYVLENAEKEGCKNGT
jgi:hypothetical protein